MFVSASIKLKEGFEDKHGFIKAVAACKIWDEKDAPGKPRSMTCEDGYFSFAMDFDIMREREQKRF